MILDSDGSLSFDVVKWCERQGISIVWVSWEGEVSVLTAGHPADAAMIRAQVTMTAEQKLALATDLVVGTLKACVATLSALKPMITVTEASREQEETISAIHRALPDSLETLRLLEARAAKAYFGAWRTVLLRWAGTRRHPIPETWSAVEGRPSAVTGTNRRATHPVNAILNYAYGVLEGEVRIAIAVRGLDATQGVLHASHPGRHALAYDLMEPLRPVVDRAVIRFLEKETLHPADFPLEEDGSCRLHPELARKVAGLVQVDAMPVVQEFVTHLQALR